MRYFFPGAKYPMDHFCCPAATLEFEGSERGITVSLREVGKSFALTMLCVPGDEAYTCEGAESRYAHCKLTATPSAAERYSSISLECTDKASHLTLTAKVERDRTLRCPSETAGALSESQFQILRGALAGEDSRTRDEAICALAERRDPATILSLIELVGRKPSQDSWGAYEVLKRISGTDLGPSVEMWTWWWNANKDKFSNPGSSPSPNP